MPFIYWNSSQCPLFLGFMFVLFSFFAPSFLSSLSSPSLSLPFLLWVVTETMICFLVLPSHIVCVISFSFSFLMDFLLFFFSSFFFSSLLCFFKIQKTEKQKLWSEGSNGGRQRDEEHPSSDTNCWEWTRPPVRKRSYNNLFKGKNLRMGDVKQHNTHRERERGTKRYISINKSMQQLQMNNKLYKRLQSHYI